MKKTKKKNIKRELPPIGTILNGKFKGIPYNAKIVSSKTNGKSVAFNSKIYKSMSAAACAITKQPTNGWRFWKF